VIGAARGVAAGIFRFQDAAHRLHQAGPAVTLRMVFPSAPGDIEDRQRAADLAGMQIDLHLLGDEKLNSEPS